MFDFQQLRSFTTVVVTGPQRSGTRITATIIAKELDRRYVDELDYGVHFFDRFWRFLTPGNVVHAPAMSAYCHLLPPAAAVVLVRRSIEEIIESQRDVRLEGGDYWTDVEEPRELSKYFREPGAGPISSLKYDIWERYEKPLMAAQNKPFFELMFPHDLEGHSCYVPPGDRVGWAPFQIAP